MNDQIEKFRSYIDDELEIQDRLEFEKSLSKEELQELEDDILIKKLLSESSEELPIDYMRTLNQKLSQAHNEVFEKQHNLSSIFEKIAELCTEFFSTFKRPRYMAGLASFIVVIIIAANMNSGLVGENSFYKRVSREMSMQQSGGHYNEDSNGAYDYGAEGDMISSDETKDEAGDFTKKPEIVPRMANPLAKSNSADLNGAKPQSVQAASEELKAVSDSNDGASNSLKKQAEAGFESGNLETKTEQSKESDENFKADKNKKIIYSASVEIETENYADFESNFDKSIAAFGAYVDSRNIRSYKVEEDGVDKVYKHADIVIRLKSEKFFEFLEGFREFSDVVNENISSEDITLVYHDAVQKKKNLEAREAALLKLMEKAQTMEDIIAVDREISTVRAQIEEYGDRLVIWDDQVEYSTIRLYVTEIETKKPRVKPIPKNFGEKMADTFIVSINNVIYFAQNLVLLFIYNIINIILVIIVIAVVIGIIKKHKKKKH